MTAIINTYNKIYPVIIVYKTIITNSNNPKTINLYIQSESGTLTANLKKAHQFNLSDLTAINAIISILNPFINAYTNHKAYIINKNDIEDVKPYIFNIHGLTINEKIILKLTQFRTIEIYLDKFKITG